MEIIIILLLIVVNGILAMAEIAVVSARKARLQQLAETGNAGAGSALELANQPSHFLSTVQIGITLVGILTGAFGGATVAGHLEVVLNKVPFLAPYSKSMSVALVVLAITYFSLVIGELAPKQIALNDPERIAAAVAPLMKRLSQLASPLVHFLSISTNLAVRLLGVRPSSEPSVTEEEVKILIEQGTEVGVFEPVEEEMVEQVFRLGDLRVKALMTPRLEMVWLDLEDPLEKVQHKIATSGYSQFPVAPGNVDQVLGMVRAKDLLIQCMAGCSLDLMAGLQPPLFIPESMPAFETLERFKETGMQMAFVLDEFGGIQGLVTTTDILEAIVGDIPDVDEPQDPDIVQREDGSYLLDGMLTNSEFKDLFQIKELPGEQDNYFHTLGGFVMTFLGRIPTESDNFEWEGLHFEVMDMDGRRIDKVLVKQNNDDQEAA